MLTSLEDSQKKNFGKAQNFFIPPTRFREEAREFLRLCNLMPTARNISKQEGYFFMFSTVVLRPHTHSHNCFIRTLCHGEAPTTYN